MEPFAIHCTTCRTRLKVRDPSTVGQILACPKCGSMVLVEPPGPRTPPSSTPPAAAVGAVAGNVVPPEESATLRDVQPATEEPAATADVATSDPAVDVRAENAGASAAGAGDGAEEATSPNTADAPALLPNDAWSSPASQRLQEWLLMGAAAVVGVASAVTLLGYVAHRATSTTSPPPAAATTTEVEPAVSTSDNATRSVPPPAEQDPNAQQTVRPTTATPTAADAKHSPAPPIEPLPPDGSPGADKEPASAPDASPPGLVPRATTEDTDTSELDVLAENLRKLTPLINAAPFPSNPELDRGSQPATDPTASATRMEETPRPRPAPRDIDVAARLADELLEIEFPEIMLADFLDFISDFSTVPITMDLDALARMQVRPQTVIQYRAAGVSVADALSQVLKPLGLDYRILEDQLRVGGPLADERELRERTIDVSDLVDSEPQRGGELDALIVSLIAPDRWAGQGGGGQLRWNKQTLVIRQTAPVHFQVLRFCEKLRVARGLTPRSDYPSELFQLEPRWKAARERLATRVTLNYTQPTLLTRILQRLGRETDVRLVVDWQAAASIGWTRDTETTLSTRDESLAEALDALLRPLDLTYRTVDADTIQITTQQVRDARVDLEFYDAAKLIPADATPDSLGQRVRSAVGEPLFRDRGGTGVVRFDPASGCLLVALPQPQQQLLAELLLEWQAGR